MGANHVTYKSVRLAQEVQELEERVHVEVEGGDDVVRLFRRQGHRLLRNCSRKVITVNQQCYKTCQPALLLHFYKSWEVSSPESNASDGIVERPSAECWTRLEFWPFFWSSWGPEDYILFQENILPVFRSLSNPKYLALRALDFVHSSTPNH